jgi:hypothetical protein
LGKLFLGRAPADTTSLGKLSSPPAAEPCSAWTPPAADGLAYINKVKPRLSTEIISFIAKKQYDLILIGKSNILLINNQAQLDQYKRDKSNYYFKP